MAKLGPPQQLAAWQSGYSRRVDALGSFEAGDSSQPSGYAYPLELIRKDVDLPSDDDDVASEQDRDEDGGDDAGDEDADDTVAEAEDEIADSVPLHPVAVQSYDFERSGSTVHELIMPCCTAFLNVLAATLSFPQCS